MKKNIILPLLLSLLPLGGCGLFGVSENINPVSPSVIETSTDAIIPATNNVQEQIVEPKTVTAPITPVTNIPPTVDKIQEPIVESKAIGIKSFSFEPETLTVKKGTIVTWTNYDSAPHQIKSTAFVSSQLNKNQTYSFTFSQTGIFEYYCSLHPSMLGKIIVE